MSSTDPLRFILGRRSIRQYRLAPIGDDLVQRLLEAAMAAPSAVAKDPWRFIVVRKTETLARLAEVLSNGAMLNSAGLGLVVVGDPEAAHDRQISFMLQDCSAAIENILLAAHALGLGTCWLGIHPREQRTKQVSEILGIPAPFVPVSAIAVGWPAETKEPRTRFCADYVHREQW
jgi:nitroreductase